MEHESKSHPCEHSTSLFGWCVLSTTLWTTSMSLTFGWRPTWFWLLLLVQWTASAESLECCFCFQFGVPCLSTIAVNAHTTFTFTYSSCDWIKWKAAANKHWEDILVTDSEQHCTTSLVHCSIDKALHCFATVGGEEDWWSAHWFQSDWNECHLLISSSVHLHHYLFWRCVFSSSESAGLVPFLCFSVWGEDGSCCLGISQDIKS